MKGQFCIPPLKPGTAAAKSRRFSPASILERFREAVFRLIMLSALNKVSNDTTPSSSCNGHDRLSNCSQHNYYHHPRMSTHHSEAVADCIEFIKRNASPEDDDDYAAFSVDASAELEVIRPVPVM